MEARDERAAGRAWAHAGGSGRSLVFLDAGQLWAFASFAKPIFPVQGTPGAEGPQRSEHACRRTLSYTLIGIFIHISQIPQAHLSLAAPVLCSLAGSPTHSLSPQPSMAPYCLERKSGLPTLTSGALPDLTRYGLAQAPWTRVEGLWFCFFFFSLFTGQILLISLGILSHIQQIPVIILISSSPQPHARAFKKKKKINKWVLMSLKRIHPILFYYRIIPKRKEQSQSRINVGTLMR